MIVKTNLSKMNGNSQVNNKSDKSDFEFSEKNEKIQVAENIGDVPAQDPNNHPDYEDNNNKGVKEKGQTDQSSRQQTQANNNNNTNNNSTTNPPTGEISLAKKLTIDLLMVVIKCLIFTYDLISQPIFYFKHQVYNRQHEFGKKHWSKQLDAADPDSPWRQIDIEPNQLDMEKKINSFETYDEMMKESFRVHAKRPSYGFRTVIHEQWIKRPESDKLFRQVKLSDYQWVTYEQFDRQVEAARRGFLVDGVKPGDKVMIYADTRPEWQISSQALIRLGAIVATMYSTLGVDGIIHSVNETQVNLVVTQKDKVNKLLRLKAKLPNLKKIIYFDPVLRLMPELVDGHDQVQDGGKTGSQQDEEIDMRPDFEHKEVDCMSFRQLLRKGLAANEDNISVMEARGEQARASRTKDSVAVIMYTSGSTGIPKGVLISHGNIMATIKSFTYVTKDFIYDPKQNSCTAYLPLAHIFEFCIESVMLYHGVRFGFATPHTLTDKSPGLMPGQVGDLTLLKPTVMIIVPLILDRIVQGVKQALKQQSYFKEQLVTYLIKYKSYWMKKHYDTPLVDRIVCSKVSQALGGKARFVISGSAPLSPETQSFVRSAFNMKLPQGFGTTETCAATACQLFDDQSTGNVGLPVAGSLVKLEPWLEGNYRPTDKPNPRGEIVVGGEMIAHGYFNLDEQTEEAFYVDNKGVRWYRTGDIGEFLPNGNLKIIDRKKDLVKLQNGEYVSLGKVESTLKSNPYLDNFCVYANSAHNYVVALGPANEAAIVGLAQQIVDQFDRSSPSLATRRANGFGTASCVMSEKQQVACVESLRQVLALYEADRLASNNNQEDSARAFERKMSSLSTQSTPGGSINERLQSLCDNGLLHERVLAFIRGLAEERGLMSLEVPKKLLLLAEEWTEDKNLVTAAMKIRRNYIYKRYQQDLDQLYPRSK